MSGSFDGEGNGIRRWLNVNIYEIVAGEERNVFFLLIN